MLSIHELAEVPAGLWVAQQIAYWATPTVVGMATGQIVATDGRTLRARTGTATGAVIGLLVAGVVGWASGGAVLMTPGSMSALAMLAPMPVAALACAAAWGTVLTIGRIRSSKPELAEEEQSSNSSN